MRRVRIQLLPYAPTIPACSRSTTMQITFLAGIELGIREPRKRGGGSIRRFGTLLPWNAAFTMHGADIVAKRRRYDQAALRFRRNGRWLFATSALAAHSNANGVWL